MLETILELSDQVLRPFCVSTLERVDSLLGRIPSTLLENLSEQLFPSREEVQRLRVLVEEQRQKLEQRTKLIELQGNSNLGLKGELQAARSRALFFEADWNRVQRSNRELQKEVERLQGVEIRLRRGSATTAANHQRRLREEAEATLAASQGISSSPVDASTQTVESTLGAGPQIGLSHGNVKLSLQEFNNGGSSASTTIDDSPSANSSSRSSTTATNTGRRISESNAAASFPGPKKISRKLAKKAKKTAFFDPRRVPVGYAEVVELIQYDVDRRKDA